MAVCLHCKVQLKIGGGSTNGLNKHLKRKHPNIELNPNWMKRRFNLDPRQLQEIQQLDVLLELPETRHLQELEQFDV